MKILPGSAKSLTNSRILLTFQVCNSFLIFTLTLQRGSKAAGQVKSFIICMLIRQPFFSFRVNFTFGPTRRDLPRWKKWKAPGNGFSIFSLQSSTLFIFSVLRFIFSQESPPGRNYPAMITRNEFSLFPFGCTAKW